MREKTRLSLDAARDEAKHCGVVGCEWILCNRRRSSSSGGHHKLLSAANSDLARGSIGLRKTSETNLLQLNSHRLEANFRQYVLRQPMKAYDCLKPSPWDAFHRKYATAQFFILTLVTMPLDLAGTWFRAFLTDRGEPWNGPKHIKQEFKYRGKMEACLFGKTSEKWSVHG